MEEKTKLIDKQKSAKEKTGHPVMGGRFNSNQYVKALVAFTKLILCKITLKTKNVKFFSPITDIKKCGTLPKLHILINQQEIIYSKINHRKNTTKKFKSQVNYPFSDI